MRDIKAFTQSQMAEAEAEGSAAPAAFGPAAGAGLLGLMPKGEGCCLAGLDRTCAMGWLLEVFLGVHAIRQGLVPAHLPACEAEVLLGAHVVHAVQCLDVHGAGLVAIRALPPPPSI